MSTYIISSQEPFRYDDTNTDKKHCLEALPCHPIFADTLLEKNDAQFNILLNETVEKKPFIITVALLILSKALIIGVLSLLALLKPSCFDYYTYTHYLNYLGVIAATPAVVGWLVAGFYGKDLRPFLPGFYFSDVLLTGIFYLSFINYVRTNPVLILNSNTYEYLIKVGLAFCISSTSLVIALVLTRPTYISKTGRVFGLSMSIFTIVSMPTYYIIDNNVFENKNFIEIWTLSALYLGYVTVEMSLVLRYRLSKFYYNDYYWCYYSLLTSLFGDFWTDLLKVNKDTDNFTEIRNMHHEGHRGNKGGVIHTKGDKINDSAKHEM